MTGPLAVFPCVGQYPLLPGKQPGGAFLFIWGIRGILCTVVIFFLLLFPLFGVILYSSTFGLLCKGAVYVAWAL